jgi:polar amino acid transport system permease protein
VDDPVGGVPAGRSPAPSRASGRPVESAAHGRAWRPVAISIVSTVVVFTALGWVVVNAPGWPAVKESFFNAEVFAESWPLILKAFWINIQLFIVAELLILPLGLLIALMRSAPGPVFLPLRILATVYADVFRALPGVLVIFILGFGIPALGLAGIPVEPIFYAVIGLTLIYSAYVSEVYRAGIDSVHPSQGAAARSLGLSHLQALRHVILPQAVRRVIPPLLNDFIGLQKDTVLVSFIGVVEIFRQSQIRQAATFNFTPYMATAIIFVIVTIPLARFTDWLVARERRRSAAGTR